MAHNDPTQARFGEARRAAPEEPTTSDAPDAGSSAGFDPADDQTRDVDAGTYRLDGASSMRAEPSTRGTSDMPTRDRARSDAADRGKLVMAAKVVEKIAAQAASEVSAAGGTSGGVLGIGARTDLSARPKVEVHLSGTTATLEVAVAVAYPTSIRRATDRVRTHIVDRVEALAGVQVTRVDIDVTALHRTEENVREGLR